jgi:hypothetical protein
MPSEQQLRDAHAWGGRCHELYLAEPPAELSGSLLAAWLAGKQGLQLANSAVRCERYGAMPPGSATRPGLRRQEELR